MSFGVGFGDIVKAIGLAKELVERYRSGPQLVNDLALEISGLLGVLESANVVLHQRRQALAGYQQGTLLPILQGYVTVLNRLRTMHSKNHVLTTSTGLGSGSQVRKIAKRLALDPADIQSCRAQIMHYNLMLNTFLTSLNGAAIEENKQSQEHEDLLDWLNPPKLPDARFGEQHTERLRKRVENTGSWFPKLAEFTTWISESRTTLYCLGMPGAGKSILSSIAIHHLQELQASSLNEDIGVGFLLCDFKSKDAPEDLLAILLKQLLIRRREAPPNLRDLFRRYQAKLGSRPLMSELVGCLDSVINLYSRTFIVIDALDEYDTGSRTDLLEAVFQLQRTTDFNLLTTLRPIQEITAEFKSSGILLRTIEVQADDADIRAFLGHQMTRKMTFLRRVPDDTKAKIVAEIAEATRGMFLLAELYLDSIVRYRNVDDVMEAVRALPQGPDAYSKLYSDTMNRITDGETPKLALKVLSWVTWAKRPLTVREVQHALVIGKGGVTFRDGNTTAEEVIISVCEGLVAVDATAVIRLIHYTTREYLEGVRHHFFPAVEHELLGVCLGLLSDPTFGAGRCTTDAEFEGRLYRYPLFEYAVKYWGDHAKTGTNTKITQEAVLTFLEQTPNVDAASQCLLTYKTFSQSVPKNITGLYLAVWFGLRNTAEALLSRGCYSARERNTYGQSALAVAASQGHLSTLQLLLAYTAEVDSRDRIGRTPLSLAAERGYLDLAQTLANYGADPHAQDEFQRSPISYAAENGHEAVVDYLASRAGAAADLPDSRGLTPLFRAAIAKQWRVVRMLLVSHGARIDARAKDGHCPITLAAANGHAEEVAALIGIGRDQYANATDATGRTALSHAAEICRGDITALLLSAGANTMIADEDGWPPLMWATDAGWDAGVDTLLQNGKSCVSHQDRYGQTALAVACRMGHKVIAQTLLRADQGRITVNIPDRTGWTPLIQATKNGGDVLGLLLDEAGSAINMNWQDGAGKTALHWAATAGNLDAAMRFLQAAVPADTADHLQRTPLWLAARNGQGAVVAALLQHQANVNSADRLGRTALRLAIQGGHDNVVRTLLDSGAEIESDTDALVSLAASGGTWKLLEERSQAGDEEDAIGLVALFG